MPSNSKLKMYFIAGEASGDLHGGNLMRALKNQNSEIDFRFWGGEQMKAQGGTLVKHIRELAFMGFIEVLMNLQTIFKNISFCKTDILTFKPDVLVLIDYPGFNLRIADWAKRKGIKVVYYISPQVWAWKQSRVHKIKKSVDKMYVILPFEKEFYKHFDFDVDYLGHPLIDAINQYRSAAKTREEFLQFNGLMDKPIIAILPGSRKQEVRVKLPIMLKGTENFDAFQIVVAGAPSLDKEIYNEILSQFNGKQKIKVLFDQTYDVVSHASMAVVTSGTATLETALLNTPEVVCYKSSSISYHIAKRLIKVPFISLVNLIMNRPVVKELIQDDCSSENIAYELQQILPGSNQREEMLTAYQDLQNLLGKEQTSEKIAQSLLTEIHNWK